MKTKKTKDINKMDLTELVDLIADDNNNEKSEAVEIDKKAIKAEKKKAAKEAKLKAKEEKRIDKIAKKATKEDKEEKIIKANKEEKPAEEKEETMGRRKKKFKFKIDFSVIIFIVIVLIIGLLVLYLTVGQSGNKYGTRLKGIEKISFKKKDKSKVVDGLKANENVKDASIDIEGRIIYIIFDVKENVSKDDAKNIANDSLGNLSDEVKGFYDIVVIIKKTEEKIEEVTITEGDGSSETKEIRREFPISGAKRKTSDHIVW